MIKIAKEIVNTVEEEQSALAKVILMSKAIAALEDEKKRLCEAANREYIGLEKMASGQCVTIHNLAILKHNSNKSWWRYPPNVLRLESELMAAQKAAQKDGTARKEDAPPIDTKNAFLFKIQFI